MNKAVRQQGAAGRRTRSAHARVVLITLLSLLLAAATVAPVSAGNIRRAHSAEDLAVRLVNCLRTGGTVTSAGKCKGWGTGRRSVERAPLKRSAKISNQVSWPWARRTVRLGSSRSCWVGHSLSGSTVDKRFRSAGLRYRVNGENVGCGSYGPKRTVIFIVRLWQREQAYRGSHWRQIKDPRFKSIGVAVARRGTGKSQIVINFYGKRNP